MGLRLASYPLFVVLMGAGALAMLVPALHAHALSDFPTARAFFYAMILCLMVTTLLALATKGHRPRNQARSHLLTLFAAYGLLPLMLALPFYEASPRASYLDAWFEMVSSITTTGATLWDNPRDIAPTLHLWRAIVAWLGGFLVWVSAVAILAPLNLGGFEVVGDSGSARSLNGIAQVSDPSERIARYAQRLVPIYGGITLALSLALMVAGDPALVAFSHAMGIISTSGISPIGGVHWGNSGIIGEVVMVACLIFGLSRVTFWGTISLTGRSPWREDVELRLGIGLVVLASLVLFARYAFLQNLHGWGEWFRSGWGIFFTVASFLTTTGYESRAWFDSVFATGLQPPGMALLGMALIGGGVATTAGGVRLLRIYALIRHGQRETERLLHPSSLGGSGHEARRIRRHGAQIAWVFLMLSVLAVMGVLLALSLTGVQFETAFVLTIAAITTTGNLATVAAVSPISYDGLPEAAQMILGAAMVLGRLEILALIALLNPNFWRG